MIDGYGIRCAEILTRSAWLEEKRQGFDRKDEAAMLAIADAYEQQFGVRPRLVRCVPEFGPDRGKFVGFNIVE